MKGLRFKLGERSANQSAEVCGGAHLFGNKLVGKEGRKRIGRWDTASNCTYRIGGLRWCLHSRDWGVGCRV